MDRYVIVATIVTISIISSLSNASLVINSRKLIAAPPSNNSTGSQVSPVPGPIIKGDNKGLHSDPANPGNPGNEKPKDDKLDENNKHDKGVSNDTTPPPTTAKKSDEKNEKPDTSIKSDSKNSVSCDGLSNQCKDQKDMIACIETFKNGSKEIFLVVQNKGKSKLHVKITMLPSMNNALPVLELPKHQSKKINISSSVSKSTEVILNAGNGECVLHLVSSVTVENWLHQFSIYSKQVTPMYGAYFVGIIVLSMGGIWACCLLSKKRHEGEIPYQELEMGIPESASASASVNNVESAGDWDQDWDDDWDDNKSTTGSLAGSISANGLTSRSSKKEDWEDNWDD